MHILIWFGGNLYLYIYVKRAVALTWHCKFSWIHLSSNEEAPLSLFNLKPFEDNAPLFSFLTERVFHIPISLIWWLFSHQSVTLRLLLINLSHYKSSLSLSILSEKLIIGSLFMSSISNTWFKNFFLSMKFF